MTMWVSPKPTMPPSSLNLSLLCAMDTSQVLMRSKLFKRFHPPTLKCREGFCFEMFRMSAVAFVGDSANNMAGVKDHLSSLVAIEKISCNSKAVNQPMKARMYETMATQNLFIYEETELAATAEAALGLAQVAMKAAKDAAAFGEEWENFKDTLSEEDSVGLQLARRSEEERLQIVKALDHSQSQVIGEQGSSNVTCSFDFHFALKREHITKVSIDSQKRIDRRDRRLKAREKAVKVAAAITSAKQAWKSKNPVISSIEFSDPLHALRDSTNTKLLTAREEVELAKRIQDLLKLERIRACLAMQIGQEPTLNRWAQAAGIDQKTLHARLRVGQQCRIIMFNRNLGLVKYVAKKYKGQGLSFEDLVQAGYTGLIQGTEKFDYRKGFRFSTYAHWWIRQAITRSIAKHGRLIRVPQNILSRLSQIRKVKRHWYQEHGRYPSNEEVAQQTGLSVAKLRSLMICTRPPKYLYQTLGPHGNMTFVDIVADQGDCSPETAFTKQQLRKDIDKVLNTLSKQEKEVLRLRHGLDDGRPKSLTEIGELHGFTREWIRRIEANALRKIREAKASKILRYYMEI